MTECTWGKALGTTFGYQTSTMFHCQRPLRCSPPTTYREGPPGASSQGLQTAAPSAHSPRNGDSAAAIPQNDEGKCKVVKQKSRKMKQNETQSNQIWLTSAIYFHWSSLNSSSLEPAGWLLHFDCLCNMFSFCWYFCWSSSPYFWRKTNHNRLKFYCNCGSLCVVFLKKPNPRYL